LPWVCPQPHEAERQALERVFRSEACCVGLSPTLAPAARSRGERLTGSVMSNTKTERVFIRLDSETGELLAALAEESSLTKSEYIRQLINLQSDNREISNLSQQIRKPLSKRLNLRLTNEDRNLLAVKAAEAGLRETSYIRQLINGKTTFVKLDNERLGTLLYELAKQGTNLNQAVHEMHIILNDNRIPLTDDRVLGAFAGIEAMKSYLLNVYNRILDFVNDPYLSIGDSK